MNDGAYPVAAALAQNVSGDLDVGPCRGGAICVDHAAVGTGPITVDLVDGHLDLPTGRNLGELVTSLGHDGLGAGLQVVLAGADGLADGCGVRPLEARRVGLEGVAAGSITRGGGVDAEGHARATTGGSSLDDGAVGRYEGDESENGGSLHFEGLCVFSARQIKNPY